MGQDTVITPGRQALALDLKLVSKYYYLPLGEAAKELGICLTSLKRVCRRLGLKKWPYTRGSTTRPAPPGTQVSDTAALSVCTPAERKPAAAHARVAEPEAKGRVQPMRVAVRTRMEVPKAERAQGQEEMLFGGALDNHLSSTETEEAESQASGAEDDFFSSSPCSGELEPLMFQPPHEEPPCAMGEAANAEASSYAAAGGAFLQRTDSAPHCHWPLSSTEMGCGVAQGPEGYNMGVQPACHPRAQMSRLASAAGSTGGGFISPADQFENGVPIDAAWLLGFVSGSLDI